MFFRGSLKVLQGLTELSLHYVQLHLDESDILEDNRSMVELKVTFVISPNECKMGSAAERLHVGAGVGLGAGLGIGVGLGLGCGARYLGYVFKCVMLCTGTVSILSVSIHGFLGEPVSEKTDVLPEKRTNLSS